MRLSQLAAVVEARLNRDLTPLEAKLVLLSWGRHETVERALERVQAVPRLEELRAVDALVVEELRSTVHLIGGPMDGWYVAPGADALEPAWGEIAIGEPFAYVLDGLDEDFVPSAEWRGIE